MNQIKDICNTKNTSVPDIVKILEEMLNKKGVYKIIDAGGNPEVRSSDIGKIAADLGINFDDYYPKKVIYKYYSNL